VSENQFDVVLERLTDQAVGRLLKSDTFDASAFDALEDHIWQKAEGLQSEYAISKQILLSLRSAGDAIRIKRHRELVLRRHANLVRQGCLVTLHTGCRRGLL
jgi:hypothetical protein